MHTHFCVCTVKARTKNAIRPDSRNKWPPQHEPLMCDVWRAVHSIIRRSASVQRPAPHKKTIRSARTTQRDTASTRQSRGPCSRVPPETGFRARVRILLCFKVDSLCAFIFMLFSVCTQPFLDKTESSICEAVVCCTHTQTQTRLADKLVFVCARGCLLLCVCVCVLWFCSISLGAHVNGRPRSPRLGI